MKRWTLVLGLAVFCCADLAFAGGPEKNPLSPWYYSDAERWWQIEGLLGVELEPDYVGSDDGEFEPSALLRALFKDRWGNRYTVAFGEVGAVFYPGENWALAIDLEYEEGRETENEDLRGLPEGDTTLEGEFALFRRFGNGYGFAVFQPDLLDRGKGIVYFLGYGYDHLTRDERWLLSPRVDISWADREHMQTEFGLTAAEAAILGQDVYTPGGGLKSATLGLSAQRYFRRKWSWLMSVEVEYYFNKAADSPLIANLGSDVTFESSFGIFYRF